MADGKRRLEIEILSDAKGVKQGFGEAEGAAGKFSGTVAKIGGVVAGAFAVTKIAEFAGDTINAASDLNEEMSKSEVVFGDASKAIQDFAEGAAKGLGQSKEQALQAASNFAIFGKAAQLTGTDLVKFSTDMVGLASDMASFSNTTPDEAIEAIGAALRGESEPIRKYGVLLDDAKLKQRAMTLGIYDGVGALTSQQKVLAAQAEILAQTGDAQGDFARTSDGLANKQRILAAQMENLKAEIGEKLLPIVLQLTDALVGLFEKFESVGRGFNKIEDKAVSLGHKITDLVGRGDATNMMFGRFGPAQEAAAEGMDNLTKATKTLLGFMDDLTTSTKDLTMGLGDGVGQAEGIADATKRYSDTLQAQIDKTNAAADANARLLESTKHLRNEQLGLEGATYNALDAIDSYTAKVKEGDSSLRELAQSSISAQENFGSLAAKAIEAAAAQAELHGGTLTANDALDAQVDALQKLYGSLASDSPLRKALDEYILALYNIPGQVHTDVDFSGTDPITGRAIGGIRREGTGAGGSAASGSAIVSDIKAYEASNGKSWRS